MNIIVQSNHPELANLTKDELAYVRFQTLSREIQNRNADGFAELCAKLGDARVMELRDLRVVQQARMKRNRTPDLCALRRVIRRG